MPMTAMDPRQTGIGCRPEMAAGGSPAPVQARPSTTIDARLVELDAMIDMLGNAADNLGQRLAAVLQPVEPHDVVSTDPNQPSPYPVSGLSEQLAIAARRVDIVRARLVDWNHRLDFDLEDA